MDNNIMNLKEKYKEKIESKASEEYGVVKLGEDSYIVPANVVNTKSIELDFKESNFYKDENLKKDIARLDIISGDYISISCKGILNDNKKILEVVVIGTDEINDLTVTSDLNYEERELLLNMIAYIHKDKEVYVTFYLHYNFELVQELISE